jgi:CheY-like chemotaxis protein
VGLTRPTAGDPAGGGSGAAPTGEVDDQAGAVRMAQADLLTNLSHEIRTPMNAIMGMAQLLQFTELTERQRECVRIIQSSSQGLLRWVGHIVDLARLDAGHAALERRSFGLRHLVSQVIDHHRLAAAERRLSLESAVDPGVPDAVLGDPTRLAQVLDHLTENAVKFTARGSVRIVLTVGHRQSDRLWLHVRVIDTGEGMGAETLARLFDAGTPAAVYTARLGTGTGLGLALCTRWVAMMEGVIWAESRQDRGSTFFLDLPLGLDAAMATAAPAASPTPGPPLAGWPGPPLRVLLVDDQSGNLLFARRVLEAAGHAVVEARDGRQAVAAWAQGEFDLILMDIQMPQMNGIEAARAIRDQERPLGRHIPIIALTAYALPEERQAILSQGMDGYVAKPLEVGDLHAEMWRCWQAAGGHPGVRADASC